MPDSPPRYYRVQLVLSDADADLKAWCWENRGGTCTATIRQALRGWIASDTHALPATKSPSEGRRMAVAPELPADAQTHEPPPPANQPARTPLPAAVDTPADIIGEADTLAPDDKVKRMFSANKDFF